MAPATAEDSEIEAAPSLSPAEARELADLLGVSAKPAPSPSLPSVPGKHPKSATVEAGLSRRQVKFLESLSESRSIANAREAAGWRNLDFFKAKRSCAAFSLAFDSVMLAVAEYGPGGLWQRAVEGVAEPITWEGEIVSWKTVRSDRLLELLLKASDPKKYRDTQKIEHSGNIGHSVVVFPATAVDVAGWEAASLAVTEGQKLSPPYGDLEVIEERAPAKSGTRLSRG